jgi:hypothetical protein
MIEMVGAVPQRIPVGQRVDLRMHLTKGDSSSTKAKIFYQLDDGPVQQVIKANRRQQEHNPRRHRNAEPVHHPQQLHPAAKPVQRFNQHGWGHVASS